MLALLLLLEGSADGAMAHYRALTAAEQHCVADASRTDVTVCGLRGADRFRVPFATRDTDARAIPNAPQEREALIARRAPVQELSPFLVGGGMMGVHFSTRGGLSGEKARPLAR